MSPQRIFVTGGAGFVGRAAVCELLTYGLNVRCLVRRADAAAQLLDAVRALGGARVEGLEIVFGALRGGDPVDPRWLAGCDVVIHAAGLLDGAASVLVRENVTATRALIDASVSGHVRRFVLVSSLSVYASQLLSPGSILDETCPIEPSPERRGAYVYSKVVQEAVCRDAVRSRGLPLVTMRLGVVFGPGRSCLTDRVGPRLGRLLALVDPDRPLPCTFVANCASALAAAALRSGLEGETFNIVDDEMPTARQLVDAYRKSGGDLCVVRVPRWTVTSLSRLYARWHARAAGQLPSGLLPYVIAPLYRRMHFSNAAAKARLPWQPGVGLRTALRATAGSRAVGPTI